MSGEKKTISQKISESTANANVKQAMQSAVFAGRQRAKERNELRAYLNKIAEKWRPDRTPDGNTIQKCIESCIPYMDYEVKPGDDADFASGMKALGDFAGKLREEQNAAKENYGFVPNTMINTNGSRK